MNAENDPEKKKQIQNEIEQIQQDFQKSNYNKQDLSTVMANKEAPLSNKSAGISSIDAKDFVIRTLPEDTVVGMGGTALGRTDEMVKLLIEQNQHLNKQNTLLASINNKETNIVMDGTKLGTTMSTGAFKTA